MLNVYEDRRGFRDADSEDCRPSDKPKWQAVVERYKNRAESWDSGAGLDAACGAESDAELGAESDAESDEFFGEDLESKLDLLLNLASGIRTPGP